MNFLQSGANKDKQKKNKKKRFLNKSIEFVIFEIEEKNKRATQTVFTGFLVVLPLVLKINTSHAHRQTNAQRQA